MDLRYSDNIIKIETFYDKISKRKVTKILEKNVVVIVPFLDLGHLIMERHYRPVIRKTIYELPAGHIEKGERPIDAAKRELLEETGYSAQRFIPMFKAYSMPGTLSSLLYTFIARNLEMTDKEKDKNEKLTVTKMNIKKTYQLIKSNKIIDQKTIAALLYYKNFISH